MISICAVDVSTPRGAALQHRIQQVPTVVGHQLQQRLIHGGQRYFGIRCGLAVGQLDLNSHLGLAAHGVTLLVGLDADVQLVGLGADADFCYPQSRKAGLLKSTSAVGATYSRPSYQKRSTIHAVP